MIYYAMCKNYDGEKYHHLRCLESCVLVEAWRSGDENNTSELQTERD